MKNVLIINGHQKWEGVANGDLTQQFVSTTNDFLKENGFNIKNTITQSDYVIQDELDKFAWADYIFLQFPIYWMGAPWLTKKYIDEIFSHGYGTVTYVNDGRSSTDPSKKYGTGGLLKQKKYMLSVTYNSPQSEFDNEDGFFEGMNLDEANVATHKTFKYCGAQPLESYSLHDVHKGDLDITHAKQEFVDVLRRNFLT
ncbi:flavodoxin [Arcobacter sp. 31_11_sub10_T18]|nr:flavodoxin [Arcobacter sp. 31_11_sub10_T18]